MFSGAHVHTQSMVLPPSKKMSSSKNVSMLSQKKETKHRNKLLTNKLATVRLGGKEDYFAERKKFSYICI